MKPKRKPKFRVGQVVASCLSRDVYLRVVRLDGRVHAQDPELGVSSYLESDLRSLTAREVGPGWKRVKA